MGRPKPRQQGWLWAHPSPAGDHRHRGDVADALGNISEALREAYTEATSTLAGRHWSSSANQARRTLEGLVKHLLEDHGYAMPDRPVLAHLLAALPKHVDLGKPLTDTAEAVKDGGNLASHYDALTTATPDLAVRMVELVEAMVDYLLVLPDMVDRLRTVLESPAAAPTDVADGGDEAVGQ